MGAKTTRPPAASAAENDLQNLDVELAKSLAGSSLGQGWMDTMTGSQAGIQGFMQNPFQLSAGQEALLQQQGNQQLGQLLGNATSRGLGTSSIAGGAIGGLASGLIGQRYNMALQNVQQLSQLQDQAMRNRMLLQQSVESPWQMLADLRFKTAAATKKTGGMGGLIGGIIGAGAGALIGQPMLGASLGSGIGNAVGGGGDSSGGGGNMGSLFSGTSFSQSPLGSLFGGSGTIMPGGYRTPGVGGGYIPQ